MAKEVSKEVRLDYEKGIVVVGRVAMDYFEVAEEAQDILRRAKENPERTRETFAPVPVERKAAMIFVTEGREEKELLLSLAGHSEGLVRRYSDKVISHLPSFSIAELAVDEQRTVPVNLALLESMNPEDFARTVEDSLETVDSEETRRDIILDWLEMIVEVEEEKRAELLEALDIETLEAALSIVFEEFEPRDLEELREVIDSPVDTSLSEYLGDERLVAILEAVNRVDRELFRIALQWHLDHLPVAQEELELEQELEEEV